MPPFKTVTIQIQNKSAAEFCLRILLGFVFFSFTFDVSFETKFKHFLLSGLIYFGFLSWVHHHHFSPLEFENSTLVSKLAVNFPSYSLTQQYGGLVSTLVPEDYIKALDSTAETWICHDTIPIMNGSRCKDPVWRRI